VKAYETALDYIIDLNIRGVFFIEEYATLLLTKILTPFSTGFVDLQSPSGAGLSGVVYETNGDVYIADEARMLAKRTGDKTFCMGNVHTDSYESIFCGKKLFNFAKTTTIEANPGCAWCVYQTYCGSDPIRNYIEGDEFEFLQSKGDFCKKHRAIFDLLFQYLIKQDDRIVDVFWSWITHRSLSELKLGDSIKK
jgi:radical SAM protein with 4Fe4S-binding SPASM domain